MNKTDLIEHIAADADISKAAATRALESALEINYSGELLASPPTSLLLDTEE